MSTANAVYLAVLAVCTAASGFFSGSETAFIGVSRERVHRMGNGKRGVRVQQLVSNPDRLLSTLLVANNLVNILAAAVATTMFISLVGEDLGPWVATAVVTAVILVFGEITPKTIAARHPERFALAVAPTIWRLSIVLSPIARFFAAITRGLLRLIRVPVGRGTDAVTEEDIRALAELGERSGHIEEIEREILDALFDLADTQVREVMTPRTDVVSLTHPVTMEDVRTAVAATGHSRYPVSSGDLDDLLGILYVKDLVRHAATPTAEVITAMLRPPHYVPESATILDSLQEMRRRRFTIGVVIDEHGGFEGIVTPKDLLAELVGELQDEYDPGVPSSVRLADGQWITDGRLPLWDLEETLGCRLAAGPYSTVAGFYLSAAGSVPREGDSITAEGFSFTVMRMERNRIDQIRVERVEETEAGSPA